MKNQENQQSCNLCTPFIAHDKEMEARYNALMTLNRFRALGFEKREAFINIVIEKKPEYNTRAGSKMLETYWVSRNFSATITADLELICDQLESECLAENPARS